MTITLGQEITDLFRCELTDEPIDSFSLIDSLPFKLYDYQYSMLATIVRDLENAGDTFLLRMYNYGANAVGKTTLLSIITLFHMMRYGYERPNETYGGAITSGSETQMRDTIMKELRYLLQVSAFGNYIAMTNNKIYLKDHEFTKYISFRVCNAGNVDSFAGIHSNNVLVIFDEASAILPKAFEIAESYFADGKKGLFYCAGNTTNPAGFFANNYLKKDDPVPATAKEASYHYQITRFDVGGPDDAYANRVASRYGVESKVYKERVLAQFVFDSSLRFYSVYHINEAVDRGKKLGAYVYKGQDHIKVGLDISTGSAECETVVLVRDNAAVIEMQVCPVERNKIASWLVANILLKYSKKSTITVMIDTIGVGNGIDAQVTAILSQKEYKRTFKAKVKVKGVIVSNKSVALRGCRNLKSELYVESRAWLENDGAFLPSLYLDKLVDNMLEVEQVADSSCIRIAPAKKPADYVSSFILTFALTHDAKSSYDNFLM